MKKQVVTWMLCAGCVLFPAMANTGNTPNPEVREITERDTIDLIGKLDSGQLRSGGDALSAEIVGNTLLVTFNSNVGNVSVCIKNNSGNTVYSTTVNSNSGYAVIPLSGLPSGTYTITFSNGNGAMWGQFILN